MRILIFNWRDIKNPEAGGAEVHLHEIFKRIANRGNEVLIISSKFNNCKEQEVIDGIKIIRIGNKFTFIFAVFLYYITKLKRRHFDVVIEDISKIPLYTPIYVRRNMLAIVHHIHGRILFKELPLPLALCAFLLEKLIPVFYKKALFVTVSESTKNELVNMGLPSKNIHVIFNGVNNAYLPGDKSKKPLVIYFGRIKKYKRIDDLLKAFKKVEKEIPGAELIIAGKGDQHGNLMKIASKLNLKSVTILNEISEKEKIELLQKAWVLINPSMKEGWGITIIEANACGTPAVSYNVPGLRDSIKHGYNGLLVEDGNVEALANAIIRLLKDNELREKLSRNAIEWSRRFSWDKSAEEFERIIKGVINGK